MIIINEKHNWSTTFWHTFVTHKFFTKKSLIFIIFSCVTAGKKHIQKGRIYKNATKMLCKHTTYFRWSFQSQIFFFQLWLYHLVIPLDRLLIVWVKSVDVLMLDSRSNIRAIEEVLYNGVTNLVKISFKQLNKEANIQWRANS